MWGPGAINIACGLKGRGFDIIDPSTPKKKKRWGLRSGSDLVLVILYGLE